MGVSKSKARINAKRRDFRAQFDLYVAKLAILNPKLYQTCQELAHAGDGRFNLGGAFQSALAALECDRSIAHAKYLRRAFKRCTPAPAISAFDEMDYRVSAARTWISSSDFKFYGDPDPRQWVRHNPNNQHAKAKP